MTRVSTYPGSAIADLDPSSSAASSARGEQYTVVMQQPLTDDEAALLYTVQMMGSASYPISKVGSRWQWHAWRSVGGSPTLYRTKRAAVAAFELWSDLALARWREMKIANRLLILTAVGVKELAS